MSGGTANITKAERERAVRTCVVWRWLACAASNRVMPGTRRFFCSLSLERLVDRVSSRVCVGGKPRLKLHDALVKRWEYLRHSSVSRGGGVEFSFSLLTRDSFGISNARGAFWNYNCCCNYVRLYPVRG